MAEFLDKSNLSKKPVKSKVIEDGFNAMGKPVPMHRCQAALDHCRQMGLTNTSEAMDCVSGMAQQLQRDNPYEAMAVGMHYLDIVGVYRLMAVLLTAVEREGHGA